MTWCPIQFHAVTNFKKVLILQENTHIYEHFISRMERLGKSGHWRLDIINNEIRWSRGTYEIHGLDFENYTPSLDAALDAYLPEDRADVEEHLSRCIENNEDFTFEKRIKRPNGAIRHVAVQGECEFCPETGKLISIFGVVQDITPIKQQEELYELSALGSNAAIWDWDVTTDELKWAGRSAKVLGHALNEQLPQTTEKFFETILHEDDREILKQSLVNHFTKLDDFGVEIRIKRYDGSYEWFLCRAQAQFNEYGKAIRVCGSMTSIQDLKEAQNKLEQSNIDLENFAYMAAHEIKAPIRNIASYLELMNFSEDELPKSLQPNIDKSIEIANKTGKMVDELLEYASLQDAELNLTEVNLDALTKLIVRSMKDDIKASNAKITLGNLPTITCDESKVISLITNLIQNALKYRSDETPEISIGAKENDHEWQYSVQDNGIGMQEDKIEQIFTMFTRLKTEDEVLGTGIGLNICNRIVDLHEGNIWAESELGKGSTFHFTISKYLSENN